MNNLIKKYRYVPSTVLALKLSKVFDVGVNEIFQLDEED
jgi:putative transcriptional regulator